MKRWHVILVTAVVFLAAIAALLVRLHRQEAAHANALAERLMQAPMPADGRSQLLDAREDIPAPVRDYFRAALPGKQMLICSATLQQTGELRTDPASHNWINFSASETVVPGRGFTWNARVALPLHTHLRVLDSLIAGTGTGRISVMSVLPVGEDRDNPQLNSGALHRYLAEAAWFPTALLPQSGVHWSAMDAHRAVATLAMNGVSVSLEFRFNERHEIESIYTPARWGMFNGKYEQRPWEAHFRDYRQVQGMRIPRYGEVGWYADDELQIVWRGNVENASFEMCAEQPAK